MKQHYQHKSAVISNKAFQTSEAFVSILDKDSSFKNAVLVSLNQVSQIKCLSSTQKQQYIRQINLTFYEKKSKKKKTIQTSIISTQIIRATQLFCMTFFDCKKYIVSLRRQRS